MAGGNVTRREFVAVALGVAACAGLGGCAGPSAVSGQGSAGAGAGDGAAGAGASLGAELVSAGALTVAAVVNSLPYYQEDNGVRSGFVCELMEAAAARMELGCTWSKVDSLESAVLRVRPGEQVRGAAVRSDVAATFAAADALRAAEDAAAEAAGADASAAGAGEGSAGDAAGARSSGFSTIPYLTVSQCLVAKKSSSIASVDDLAQASVGVLGGSPGQVWVEGNLPGAQVIAFATLTELFSALQARNVDAVVADTQAADYYLRVAYGDEEVVQALDGTDSAYELVIRESDEALADALSRALDDLREDGTYDGLCEAWFAAADNSRGKTDARTPEQGAPGHDKGGAV